MADSKYTSRPVPISVKGLQGGLNSTGGSLGFAENESPDLQNIEHYKFGSIAKRNGYTTLNGTPISYGGIDSYTKLLLHCDGVTTTFVDSSGTSKAITAAGAATQSATQSKFGGKSLYLDGASYVTTPDHADFDFSGGVWTIDSWIYPIALTANHVVFYQDSGANDRIQCYVTSAGVVHLAVVVGGVTKVDVATAAGAIVTGQFQHLEVCENGDTWKILVNGVDKTDSGGTDTDRASNYTSVFQIGTYNLGSNNFNGYIDEFRVSNGVCRHTSAFTPPNRPYNSETSSPAWTSLHWYQTQATDWLVGTSGTDLFKMDSLDGTWDNITGSNAITYDQDTKFNWTTFLATAVGTNGVNPPIKWDGTGNATALTVPAGLTTAKFVANYQNYCFLAHCTVSGIVNTTRLYWSNLLDIGTWSASDYNDLSRNDGQEITGIKVLGEKLIIFKEDSIYQATFTGDSYIPFVFAKTYSSVGCIAPQSIQEVENGLIFLSHDGFYYFDGSNSFKMSHKISATLQGYDENRFRYTCSMYQKTKNKYWCSFTDSGSTGNSKTIVYDAVLQAYSVYTGMSPNVMCMVRLDGGEERPYFGDYSGYVYRADVGNSDYPLGVKTAINSYYYTLWTHYDDLVNKKGVPHVYVYHQNFNATLTFSYSYDFESSDTYSQTFSTSGGTSLYGSAVYGTGTYAGTGGRVNRRDLTGRGRVIRIKFSNNTLDETFQVDGFGSLAYLETKI